VPIGVPAASSSARFPPYSAEGARRSNDADLDQGWLARRRNSVSVFRQFDLWPGAIGSRNCAFGCCRVAKCFNGNNGDEEKPRTRFKSPFCAE
jgi:hypothetical protein